MSDRTQKTPVSQNASTGHTKTLLQQAEHALGEALEQNRALQSQFNQRIGEFAHEIKNPLNSILGFSDMLMNEKHGELGDPRYKDYAELINSSARHLLKICQAELDNAKSNAKAPDNSRPLEMANIDIKDTLDDTIKSVVGLAHDLGVTIRTDIAPDFPMLKTDPVRLKQILQNIVSNAVKFTPEGGHVDVKAKVDELDGAVVLVIQDTGFGMATEDILKVMQPFERIEDAPNFGEEGTGLGLSIANRLAHEIGAALEIRSQLNVGTMATLKFQAEDTAAS